MEISVPEFTRDNDRGQVGIETLIVFIAMILVAAIAASVLINTAGYLQNQASETSQDSEDQVSNQVLIISSIGEVAEVGGTDDQAVEITLVDDTTDGDNWILTADPENEISVTVTHGDSEDDNWDTSTDYTLDDAGYDGGTDDVTVEYEGETITLTNDQESDEFISEGEDGENQIREISMTVMQSPGADEIDLGGASIEYIGPDGQRLLTHEDGFVVDGTQDPDGTAPVLTERQDRFTVSIALEDNEDDLRYLQAGEDATVRITTQSGSEAVTIVNVPQSISSYDDGDAVEL